MLEGFGGVERQGFIIDRSERYTFYLNILAEHGVLMSVQVIIPDKPREEVFYL